MRVAPLVLSLFDAAKRGQLVVCAGAGLSRAQPTGLPTGETLGRLLDQRFAESLAGYTSPGNPENLLAVADSAASLLGGTDALRSEVLTLAEFLGASPNEGHEILALLLCEGGIDCLLLWNWDTCVERVSLGAETLQVAHSLDDVKGIQQPFVAKIHGCATRPRTLLVTSEHLTAAPLWTERTFAERLRGKTIVFVGIGDVADYAARRLEQLATELPDSDFWVVSPTIVRDWPTSEWSRVLPNLAAERRVPMTSDEFFRQLATRWADELTLSVDQARQGMKNSTQSGLNRVEAALGALSPAGRLRWSRINTVRPQTGTSSVRSDGFAAAITGLAVLDGENASGAPLKMFPNGGSEIAGERIDTLVTTRPRSADDVRAEARRRAEILAGDGLVADCATFLVAGTVLGDLTNDPDAQLDIAGSELADPTDVVAGPSAVELRFEMATDLMRRV